jgi:hypothetical protein
MSTAIWAESRVGAHDPADVQPGDAGHGDVEQQQIGPPPVDHVDRGGAVGRSQHPVAGPHEDRFQRGTDVRIVLGDEHGCSAARVGHINTVAEMSDLYRRSSRRHPATLRNC